MHQPVKLGFYTISGKDLLNLVFRILCYRLLFTSVNWSLIQYNVVSDLYVVVAGLLKHVFEVGGVCLTESTVSCQRPLLLLITLVAKQCRTAIGKLRSVGSSRGPSPTALPLCWVHSQLILFPYDVFRRRDSLISKVPQKIQPTFPPLWCQSDSCGKQNLYLLC